MPKKCEKQKGEDDGAFQKGHRSQLERNPMAKPGTTLSMVINLDDNELWPVV